MRVRKRAVVVETMRWTGDNLSEIVTFMGVDSFTGNGLGQLIIPTKEGSMIADVGDWIIKEPFPTGDRKFYPCKPDIFEQTYVGLDEDAEETNNWPPSCTCDEPGDGRCPIHWRENELQDRVIHLEEILKEWFTFVEAASFIPPWKEQGAVWYDKMKRPTESTLTALGKCLVTLKPCEEMPQGENVCGCRSCEVYKRDTFHANNNPSLVPGPSPDPVGDEGVEGPDGMEPTPCCPACGMDFEIVRPGKWQPTCNCQG